MRDLLGGSGVLWSTIAAPLLLVVGLLAVLLFVSARSRLLFLIFGGLTALGSSQEFDFFKLAYLAGVAFVLGTVIINLRIRRPCQKQLTAISFCLVTLIGYSLVVALMRGILVEAWLRNISPILLLAAVPLFVLDVAGIENRDFVLRTFMLAGLLASISFTVEWLARRGLTDLPLSHLALSSWMLPGALFSYASAAALYGSRSRLLWGSVAALIPCLFLVTGTRSGLTFLIIPLAMALVVNRPTLQQMLKGGAFAMVILSTALLGTAMLARVTGADTTMITNRLSSIGQILKDPSSDQSYLERVSQTRELYGDFSVSPFFGVAPGNVFSYELSGGQKVNETSTVVDSPMVFPAKFGIIGVLLLLVAARLLVFFVRRLIREDRLTVPRLALLGYITFVGSLMLVTAPLTDKGLGFGLLFLLVLSLPGNQAQTTQILVLVARSHGYRPPLSAIAKESTR